MRALGVVAVAVLLPACQMGLPAEQSGVENTRPATQADTSAETNLGAAFEQAALAAQVDTATENKGFLSFLKPKTAPAPAILAGTDIEVVEGASMSDKAVQSGAITTAGNASRSQDSAPVLEATKPVKSGLFGFLKPKAAGGVTQAALKAPEPDVLQNPNETPEVAGESAPQVDDVIEALPNTKSLPQKSIFGFLKSKGGTSKANKSTPKKSHSTVAPGEVLPFGTVGISCEARPKDMGQRVDQFPSSGSATWQIFDTDPSSTAPRTQFITGFKDGCARQVTAALILFGSSSLHEVHRYSKARSEVSWSKADKSYATIKSKVCSVGRKAPCPSGKVDKLEKHMAFVSVYKQFGDTTGWLELLLHNGKLATQELR